VNGIGKGDRINLSSSQKQSCWTDLPTGIATIDRNGSPQRRNQKILF
jgi:hypothetical protein